MGFVAARMGNWTIAVFGGGGRGGGGLTRSKFQFDVAARRSKSCHASCTLDGLRVRSGTRAIVDVWNTKQPQCFQTPNAECWRATEPFLSPTEKQRNTYLSTYALRHVRKTGTICSKRAKRARGRDMSRNPTLNVQAPPKSPVSTRSGAQVGRKFPWAATVSRPWYRYHLTHCRCQRPQVLRTFRGLSCLQYQQSTSVAVAQPTRFRSSHKLQHHAFAFPPCGDTFALGERRAKEHYCVHPQRGRLSCLGRGAC